MRALHVAHFEPRRAQHGSVRLSDWLPVGALLSEHLVVVPTTVKRAIDTAGGSLIDAIEALRGPGRSLVPFEPPEFGVAADALLRENDLLDAELPARRWRSGRLRRLRQRIFGKMQPSDS